MLRRLLLILAAVLVLALGAVLLGPFLISTSPNPVPEPAESTSAEVGRFVRIDFPGTDGIDLHYLAEDAQEQSGAPTFLLLHGFTFNAHTWAPVTDFFRRRGRVLAYDQIPYGLSAKPSAADWSGPNPYSKEAAISQLFSFMDALAIERATLVGNSSGGTLALEAALAEPRRVERLILVAPWVYAQRPTVPPWVAGLPQMRRIGLFIARKLGQGGLLDYSYAHPERIDERRRDLMAIHTRMAGWDLAWGELLNRSLYSPVDVGVRLGEVAQPALVLTGEKDGLVPVADTERVAGMLPDATLEVLPDCGHVPQEECPKRFERAVSIWLGAGNRDRAP
jgi:pimeloyl-ACP methyl ester carboxylesterase